MQTLAETCHLSDFSRVFHFGSKPNILCMVAKRGQPEGEANQHLSLLFCFSEVGVGGRCLKMGVALLREEPTQLGYESKRSHFRSKEMALACICVVDLIKILL